MPLLVLSGLVCLGGLTHIKKLIHGKCRDFCSLEWQFVGSEWGAGFYKCDACGAIDTTHFRDGLRRLPQVYAVHVNRTLPNGVRTAFPNREHGRRILTKLALLAQSRCAESVAFEDTLDLKDMLLYQRKAALDHR